MYLRIHVICDAGIARKNTQVKASLHFLPKLEAPSTDAPSPRNKLATFVPISRDKHVWD